MAITVSEEHLREVEEERDYYKRLSEAALDYIKEIPCDHDIVPEQKDAWNKLQSIIKEREK